MYCSNCGKKVEDGAQFCSGCGATIGSAVKTPGASPIRVPQIPSIPMGAIVRFLISIICLIVALVIPNNCDDAIRQAVWYDEYGSLVFPCLATVVLFIAAGLLANSAAGTYAETKRIWYTNRGGRIGLVAVFRGISYCAYMFSGKICSALGVFTNLADNSLQTYHTLGAVAFFATLAIGLCFAFQILKELKEKPVSATPPSSVDTVAHPEYTPNQWAPKNTESIVKKESEDLKRFIDSSL